MCLQLAVFLMCCSALTLGIEPSLTDRINGGTAAARGEFPWQVSIQIKFDNVNWDHFCSATIISKDFIISTWQCLPYGATSRRVVAGSLEWATPGSVHSITEVFTPDSEFYISVGRVEPPFEFGPDTAAVRLPAQDAESTPGALMTASGWGTLISETPHDSLVKLDLPIVDKATCESVYAANGYNFLHLICAGMVETGVGVCHDTDIGDPLVFNGELRGLFYYAYFCGRDPDVFVEVSRYRSWITEITGL